MSSFGKLELNSQGPILLRTERIDLIGSSSPYTILYISDLHLGWQRSHQIVRDLIKLAQTQAAQTQAPDLILLGGDLVDRRRGLPLLTQLVEQLNSVAPTWAIAGNHDHWVGVQWVKQAVLAAGGKWLDGRSLAVSVANKMIQIDGGQINGSQIDGSQIDGSQIDYERRLSGFFHERQFPALHQANYRILCAHNPIAMAHAQDYQLVLAGHLHGCQWVLWQQQGRLYPGAWFYRWNGLRFQQNQTTLLVSRGVGDTLPIRWNCPREVIVCQIF